MDISSRQFDALETSCRFKAFQVKIIRVYNSTLSKFREICDIAKILNIKVANIAEMRKCLDDMLNEISQYDDVPAATEVLYFAIRNVEAGYKICVNIQMRFLQYLVQFVKGATTLCKSEFAKEEKKFPVYKSRKKKRIEERWSKLMFRLSKLLVV